MKTSSYSQMVRDPRMAALSLSWISRARCSGLDLHLPQEMAVVEEIAALQHPAAGG
jgi:hypothetical protein